MRILELGKLGRYAFHIILLALIPAAFVYGIAVIKYKIFPYQQLKFIQKSAQTMLYKSGSIDKKSKILITHLLRLELYTYNLLNRERLEGHGGGITKFGKRILGVDKNGKFYLYLGTGNIKTLNWTIETNVDVLRKFISGRKGRSAILANFRVHDVVAKIEGDTASIFVSHHFWDELYNCVEFRVSRLDLGPQQKTVVQMQAISSDKWATIFRSTPCLEFDTTKEPFVGHQSGGRMAFDGSGNLIVTVGDFGHDGVNSKKIYSQDNEVSYGKIISINLSTLQSRIISKGHRNPQGLYIDADGSIWATDHGPKGGDELNLIKDQGNYGWPLVTYGTQYSSNEWPLNKHQGRHDGYELPVYSWLPGIGVSNLIRVSYEPQKWDGDLLVSSLVKATLYRFRIIGGRVILVEPMKIGERIRDIEQMHDGTILMWTDDAHFIELKIDPILDTESNKRLKELSDPELAAGLLSVIHSCQECHSFAEASSNLSAPSLWNVYGRAIASTEYENYSVALKSIGGVWGERSLKAYIANPQQFAPGTTMPNPNIDEESTLDALVKYLGRLKTEQ